MNRYTTIADFYTTEIEIKHSRFIASAKRVTSKEEAQAFLKEISKKYSDATHNCYAYVADIDGRDFKFSDDGEPSGTAGQPILEVIKKNSLYEICVVVTRYFGGIKLGASGLVGAYTEASAKLIKECNKVEMRLSALLTINIDYSLLGKIEYLIGALGAGVENKEFGLDVKLLVSIDSQRVEELNLALKEATKGRVQGELLEHRFVPKAL